MAGYDTTATALAGVTYLLATNTRAMKKLTQELRDAFSNDEEIGILSTQNLPYLRAVIDEALRIYPPGGSGMPREVPEGGETIFGQYVPAGVSDHKQQRGAVYHHFTSHELADRLLQTVLTIWQYCLYHRDSIFLQPESFIPERWLGQEEFQADHREAFQPFSYGSRNCLGRQ